MNTFPSDRDMYHYPGITHHPSLTEWETENSVRTTHSRDTFCLGVPRPKKVHHETLPVSMHISLPSLSPFLHLSPVAALTNVPTHTHERIFRIRFSFIYHETFSERRINIMVSSKKKSKSGDNINASLALMVKSGKYCLGTKQTLKSLRSGQGTWRSLFVFLSFLTLFDFMWMGSTIETWIPRAMNRACYHVEHSHESWTVCCIYALFSLLRFVRASSQPSGQVR